MTQHPKTAPWVATSKIKGLGAVCYMMVVPQGAKCCQMAHFGPISSHAPCTLLQPWSRLAPAPKFSLMGPHKQNLGGGASLLHDVGAPRCQMLPNGYFCVWGQLPIVPHAHHCNHGAGPAQCLEKFSRSATSKIMAILRACANFTWHP